MLTYELKKSPGVPLYEGLCRCIRKDILSGSLQPGEKLPSKRALAQNLEVSKITVEAAYNQLLARLQISGQDIRPDAAVKGLIKRHTGGFFQFIS